MMGTQQEFIENLPNINLTDRGFKKLRPISGASMLRMVQWTLRSLLPKESGGFLTSGAPNARYRIKGYSPCS